MNNKEDEIKSTQDIENIIHAKDVKELILAQQDKLINSIIIGLKTLFYSKKWIIYMIIALMFLPVAILIEVVIEGGPLEFKHPDEVFVDVIFDLLFPTIFIFGCLFISLPLSADEISAHSIELYLVRPIKREVYWLSRWIVINIAVYFVNIIIFLVYFLFVYAFAEQGLFVGIGGNLEVLSGVAVLLLLATLIYSGMFLLVGMIGNRGLLLGFLVAISELFFISLFFLSDNPYIPQNNIYRIAHDVLPDYFTRRDLNRRDVPKDLELWHAQIYVTIFPLVVFSLGAFYLRMREIK
jgi:ABC-type transport system involved in multi-copper enzyme maturation permease subunit